MAVTRKYTITTEDGSLAFTMLWEHEETTLDPEDFGFMWSDSDTAGELTSAFDVDEQPFNEPIFACSSGLYDQAGTNLPLPSLEQVGVENQWAGVSIEDDHYGCNGEETFIFRTMRPRKLPGNDLFDYWNGPSSAAGDFNVYDGDGGIDDTNYLTLGPDATKYRVKLTTLATAIALCNKLPLRMAREAMTPEYTARVKIYYEVPSLGHKQLLHTVQWGDLQAIGAGFAAVTCDNATLGEAGRFTGPWAVKNDVTHWLVIEYEPDMEDVDKQPEIYFAGDSAPASATAGLCYALDSDGAWSADNYQYAGPTDFHLYGTFSIVGVDYGTAGAPTYTDKCLVSFCAQNLDYYESYPSESRQGTLPTTAAGYCKLYPLAPLQDVDAEWMNVYRTLAGELSEGSSTTSPSVFYRWGSVPAAFLPEDGKITLYLAGDDTWLADQEEIKLTQRNAQQVYQAAAFWKDTLFIADRNKVYHSVAYEPENISLSTEQPLAEEIMLMVPLGDRLVCCGPSRQWLMMEFGEGFAVEEINKAGIGAASRSYCVCLTPQGAFAVIQAGSGHIYAINGVTATCLSRLTMDTNISQVLPENLKLTRIFFNAENEREIIVSICQGTGSAPTANLVFDLDLWAFTHVESMPAAAWALDRCYSTVEQNKLLGALGASVFYHYSSDADLGADIPFEFITGDWDNGYPKINKQVVADTLDFSAQAGQEITVQYFKNYHETAFRSKTLTMAGGNEERTISNVGRARAWRRRFYASDQLGEITLAAITPEMEVLGSQRQ